MKIFLIREFIPSYKDCRDKSEWRLKWRDAVKRYSQSRSSKYLDEKMLMITLLFTFSVITLLCKINFLPSSVIIYVLPLFLLPSMLIGNEHLKFIDATYFSMKEFSQRDDAPELAINADSDSGTDQCVSDPLNSKPTP